jgi:tagatose-1,6-bisphosphate aldolase
MLAVDHRQNLRRALAPSDPGSVTDADLTGFKLDVVAGLAPVATSVLLDPEYGAGQAVAAGVLPGSVGLVVALEATGYVDDPSGRVSSLVTGWSVEQAMRLGAAGVKLLVYYHPEAPNAGRQEELVEKVAEECRRHQVPFFLEPLSYAIDAGPITSEERVEVVVETARRLTRRGGDILKAEFPVDVRAVTGPSGWERPCERLTKASRIPWVLLSGGVSFETFELQTQVACRAGASGVMVGRAVWQEAVGLTGEARRAFLSSVGVERMHRLGEMIFTRGRDWREGYRSPMLPEPDWFKR